MTSLTNTQSQEFVLSNGVVVKQSPRKTTRSGYLHATLLTSSSHWDNHEETPFQTMVHVSEELKQTLKCHVGGNIGVRNWRGGFYSDPREAAYVGAIFKLNPIEVDDYVYRNGAWDDFPLDLYQLPLTFSKDDAIALIKKQQSLKVDKTSKPKTSSKRIVKIKTDDTLVNKVWTKICETYDVKSLAEKFGKESIITARNILTVNEFQLRFGL